MKHMRWLSVQLALLFAFFAFDSLSRSLPRVVASLPNNIQAAYPLPDSRFLVFGKDKLEIIDYKNPYNVQIVPVTSGLTNDWYMFAGIDEGLFAATSIINPGVTIFRLMSNGIAVENVRQYPYGDSNTTSYGMAGRGGHFFTTSSLYVPPEKAENINNKDNKKMVEEIFRSNISKLGYFWEIHSFEKLKDTYHNTSVVNYWKNQSDERPTKTWKWTLYNKAVFPIAMAKTKIRAAVCLNGELLLLDPENDNPIATYKLAFDFNPGSLAFDDEDKYLALGGQGRVIIFDANNLVVKHQVELVITNPTSSVQFSKDNKRLYCGLTHNRSYIVGINLETWQIDRFFELPASVMAITFGDKTRHAIGTGNLGSYIIELQ
jgi:hypothetical protein